MFEKLMSPEQIFDKYFLPWYKNADEIKLKLKPDMFKAVKEGTKIQDINVITDEGIQKIGNHINTMISASQEDWPTFLPLKKEFGLDGIEQFDKYYDKKKVLQLIKNSKPNDFSNEFIVTCCEFGSIIGKTMININADLQWYYNHPYWDSMIYHEKTGYMISVFSWAINKFSNYGIDDRYSTKILKCMDIIREEEKKLTIAST